MKSVITAKYYSKAALS